MELGTWSAFALACFILSVIPGPSVFLVMGQAISNGKKLALICIAGELFGGFWIMLLSLLGVGAAIAASPTLFGVIKWLGVIYLLYLGVNAIRAAMRSSPENEKPVPTYRSSFRAGFLTALFNPKSLVFYLAFFTQFVDSSEPLIEQYVLLTITAMSVAGLVLASYAMFASRVKSYISTEDSKRKFSGISGFLYLVGAGYVAVTR